MRIRRKTNKCLNCQANLDSVYNYCPNCGQENNDSNVSFQMLIGDFFNTYLALDSKFAKSIKPFFTNPGYLTNRYIEGKRASYAHPIRLYLIISIFYFFVVSMAADTLIKQEENDSYLINIEGSLTIDGFNKAENKKLTALLSEETIIKILENNDKNISAKQIEDFINQYVSEEERQKIIQELDTVTLQKIGLIPSKNRDSLIAITQFLEDVQKAKDDSLKSTKRRDATVAVREEDKDFILNRMDWKIISKYRHNKKITDLQVYDSLKLEPNISGFDRLIAKQTIRAIRADKYQLISYVMSNLPIMMLILIPLFALVLKLLYIRRKKELFIKHLIHGLHLHSFSYFIYGCCLIIMLIVNGSEEFKSILGFSAFIGVTIYTYLSFLKVYHQSKIKTFIKFNLVGLVYIFAISLSFTAEFLISILLF